MSETLASQERAGIRLMFTLLGAFSFGTLGWIGCALSGQGDMLRLGLAPALALVLVAGSGAWLGLKRQGRGARITLVLLSTAATLFWLFVPSGWWALPPPRASEVRLEAQ